MVVKRKCLLFFLLVFFSSLILSKKLPQIKGHFGESQVQKVLFELDTEKYIILNDLFLRLSSGRTSQIDHVIVSVFGIFVIETKNYTGWIFGNEKSDNWTQVIYKREGKYGAFLGCTNYPYCKFTKK